MTWSGKCFRDKMNYWSASPFPANRIHVLGDATQISSPPPKVRQPCKMGRKSKQKQNRTWNSKPHFPCCYSSALGLLPTSDLLGRERIIAKSQWRQHWLLQRLNYSVRAAILQHAFLITKSGSGKVSIPAIVLITCWNSSFLSFSIINLVITWVCSSSRYGSAWMLWCFWPTINKARCLKHLALATVRKHWLGRHDQGRHDVLQRATGLGCRE